MEPGWLHQWTATRSGVRWSRPPPLHEWTEAVQGHDHHTIGPYTTPVLSVEPGDRVRVETRDAFGGAIRSEADKPSEKPRLPFVDPPNGPIMVAGAQPGDAIAVHIESMLPRGEDSRATCCMIPHFGALPGTALTAMLAAPLPELTGKVRLDRHETCRSDRVTLPYKPHTGTLSRSPEIDSIDSLTPDNHDGDMDLPDMGPGSITYLPVRVPGARLFIGDAHACQGDGELCGTAVACPSETTLRVDQIKNWPLEWPRLEREDFMMASGSARPLEDATRIASSSCGWRRDTDLIAGMRTCC